jgi:DNA-binding transcriptional LysR family regulator
VDRTSRRVKLTKAGEQLRKEMAPAYQQVLDVLQGLSRSSQAIAGVVRLGVVHASAVAPPLLNVIEIFESRHPQCRVEIVELPFHDRHGPLRRGELDLMLTRLPFQSQDFVIGPVVDSEARVLAVARNNPLARRASASVEDLAYHHVIDLAGIGPKMLADLYIPLKTPKGRLIKRLRIKVGGFSDLVILIARDRVVQPTVASAIARFSHPSVVCIPLTGMPESKTALVWRRGTSDPRVRALIHVARDILPTSPHVRRELV